MKISCRYMLTALTVALLSLFSSVFAAEALGSVFSPKPQGKPVNLVIEPLKPLALGDHPTITVHLTAQYGQPIPNQPILIYVDGVRKAEGRTDSRGLASILLRYKFPAGTFNVRAIYPGISSIGLPRVVADVDLVVKPATVAIYTVPPTPGINFKFNHKIYTSDANGVVNLVVDTSGIYSVEVLPIDEDSLPADTRMQFSRWNDNVFTSNRTVYFPRSRRLEAGFLINYQMNQKFYDTTGNVVDPGRVSSIELGGIGNTYTFDKAGPVWLPYNRLTRRISEHLESEEIVYYFRSVIIDGANVINRSEQRFHIRPNDTWPIQVLLYSARFTARDAMFNFPIGKGIELTYPDGHKEQFFLQSDSKQLLIPSLARGSYSAKIIGVGGSAPPTPIYLSRNQDVELLMLTYLDLGLIIGIPLAIALAFFFIGRPYWLQVIRHPSRYKELVYQNTTRDISLEP